jgi:hypothetical protein
VALCCIDKAVEMTGINQWIGYGFQYYFHINNSLEKSVNLYVGLF